MKTFFNNPTLIQKPKYNQLTKRVAFARGKKHFNKKTINNINRCRQGTYQNNFSLTPWVCQRVGLARS